MIRASLATPYRVRPRPSLGDSGLDRALQGEGELLQVECCADGVKVHAMASVADQRGVDARRGGEARGESVNLTLIDNP